MAAAQPAVVTLSSSKSIANLIRTLPALLRKPALEADDSDVSDDESAEDGHGHGLGRAGLGSGAEPPARFSTPTTLAASTSGATTQTALEASVALTTATAAPSSGPTSTANTTASTIATLVTTSAPSPSTAGTAGGSTINSKRLSQSKASHHTDTPLTHYQVPLRGGDSPEEAEAAQQPRFGKSSRFQLFSLDRPRPRRRSLDSHEDLPDVTSPTDNPDSDARRSSRSRWSRFQSAPKAVPSSERTDRVVKRRSWPRALSNPPIGGQDDSDSAAALSAPEDFPIRSEEMEPVDREKDEPSTAAYPSLARRLRHARALNISTRRKAQPHPVQADDPILVKPPASAGIVSPKSPVTSFLTRLSTYGPSLPFSSSEQVTSPAEENASATFGNAAGSAIAGLGGTPVSTTVKPTRRIRRTPRPKPVEAIPVSGGGFAVPEGAVKEADWFRALLVFPQADAAYPSASASEAAADAEAPADGIRGAPLLVAEAPSSGAGAGIGGVEGAERTGDVAPAVLGTAGRLDSKGKEPVSSTAATDRKMTLWTLTREVLSDSEDEMEDDDNAE
ncbi:hypothetical protein DFJ73DRAFT_819136 [Zopfochytrium polystomum]|nr:hypothetical protein DFJ73DRAFT_819136 [Zopfochytrium polystomum]